MEIVLQLCLVLSAALYGLAYLEPNLCFCAVVPAFILIFWVSGKKQIFFSDGLVWGIVAYGLHIWPLFWSLYQIAQSWTIFAGWVFMTLYCALYAGLWFLALGRIRHVFFGPIIATGLYIWCMETQLFWIFGSLEGYPLFSPLVPLMQVSQLFYFLPFFGVWGMVFVFLLTVYSVEKGWWFMLFGCLIIWSTGFFVGQPNEQPPDWLSHVGVVRTRYKPCVKVYPLDVVQELCVNIASLRNKRPLVDIIITPESVVPCYLNMFERSLGILCDSTRGIQLLVGGYRRDGQCCYNSCYWIVDGVVKDIYDKNHGIPFVERMPLWFDCKLIRSWFLSQSSVFDCGQFEKTFDLAGDLDLIVRPLLCSELFFTNFKTDGGVVVAMVNDAWFGSTALAQLLWLSAQLKMRARGVSLIYTSYCYGCFLSSTGRVWEL